MAHGAAPGPDPGREEVRVAMALNGGVSLAVWMGGCAVELDCARRAWAGTETVPPPSAGSDKSARLDRARQALTAHQVPAEAPRSGIPDRRVYNAICTAFSRRLVVDLMTGASAGGINGALLAGAIAHGRRLHPDFIRSQWVTLGDFDDLLQHTSVAKPTSLMQGARFYDGLLTAFETLLDPGEAPDPRVLPPETQPGITREDVKLDVTTTNVAGSTRKFRDSWGGQLEAREYRARFRFRNNDEYEPALLAHAARASASFPVAFEPWKTSAQAGALAGFAEPCWVVDGGLLDNAPIRAALELIPSQPATSEVQRYVCYLNADPPSDVGNPLETDGPTLSNILGYVANLPRKAPFVDQLTAIEQATRHAGLGSNHELLELAMLDDAALVATAVALLPAYRRRRRLLSLEDLVDSPAEAAAAFENLGDRAELPWIPDVFPPVAGGWRWGVRAAQRILHLQLDLLRAAAARKPLAERTALLAARVQIDHQLGLLETERTLLKRDDGIGAALRRLGGPQADVAAEIGNLEEHITGCVAAVIERLHEATAAFYAVRGEVAEELGGEQLVDRLFGPGSSSEPGLGADRLQTFLARALGIEVVRRAFFDQEDIESAQRLRFVQLTPDTPSPVFASETRPDGWISAEAKLTGIELGHFSGFYRRSWRANDFMWGRLDAAARIVEMLVDPLRATELYSGGDNPPWKILADEVLPDDASDNLRWLVHESLGSGGPVPDTPTLRGELHERLEADLHGGEADGTFTRSLCTRAAQLEILCHELPVLVEESRVDAKLGSGSGALKLAESPRKAIENLRDEPELPLRLGRNQAEIGSTLALRTSTHAALVGLAMLRGGKLPLANLIYGVRAVLLPIAGIVSRSPIYRLGAVAGFWAAALFLAARMLDMHGKMATPLGLLVSADTIAAVTALLVVLGVAAVPGLRLRPLRWQSAIQAVSCAIILLTGGIAAIVAAHWIGHVNWAHILVAPGSHHPPTWALQLGIALLVGPIAMRFVPFLPDIFDPLVSAPWAGPLAFVVLMPVAAIIGVDSWDTVTSATHDDGWRVVVAWLAIAAAPLFTLAYAFAPQALRRRGF